MAKQSPVSVQKQNKKQISLNYALGFVAVASLLIGVWQIKNAITTPFGTGKASQNGQTSGNNGDSNSQTKDTDSDGLPDYDEINVYKTSPYLKDTDSDGIDDKAEIERGTDPNCPEGKDCSQTLANGSTNTGATVNNLNQPDMTPDQIRELLKKNGLSEAALAKYDDASLLKMYKEVASTSSDQPTSNSSTNQTNPSSTPNLTDEQKQKILALPVADLRKYLLDSGAEPGVLNKMDDTMLKTLVKQVLGL